jgi:hypothetical protein
LKSHSVLSAINSSIIFETILTNFFVY